MAQTVGGQVGPSVAADNTYPPVRLGKGGEVIVSELHGKYYEQTYRGNIYSLSIVTAAAITAFTGGAGGTPQVALYNPANSGKNAVILSTNIANVVAASAAGTVAWGLYYGPTAAITQATTTAPRNQVTLLGSGSSMLGFTNVALTGSTAAIAVMPLAEYYWATAAGAFVGQLNPADIAGQLIIPPGAYVALGGSSALTSATWIGNLIWEEVAL